jgi:hypothetical protein
LLSPWYNYCKCTKNSYYKTRARRSCLSGHPFATTIVSTTLGWLRVKDRTMIFPSGQRRRKPGWISESWKFQKPHVYIIKHSSPDQVRIVWHKGLKSEA